MKNKGFQTLLYSAAGVAVMALILVAFNVVSGALKVRMDLTEEKAYTLSEGTRAILEDLESPIKIRYYCTQPESATRDTVFLRTHARLVEDLLEEFKQAGGGRLIVEKHNPQPDPNAEDSARLDGLQGQLLSNGERFYLGLTVSQLDQKEAIPFLSPARERQLEYDVARAISRVANPVRPVIGVMSPLPLWGAPANPMMMQMGQGGAGTPPWGFITELQGDFDVRRVDMTSEEIDEEIQVLVLVHPKEMEESARFAVDQFLMRGGRLIAFLDPFAIVDSQGQNQMMGMRSGTSSSLDDLLKAWGLSFESSKVVADINLRMQLQGRDGQPMDQPTWLSISPEGMNPDDITTAEIDNVWLPMAGSFGGTPVEGLTQTVLMHSTADSQLVDGVMANLSAEQVMKDFKSDDKERVRALRLQGRFKSAFPDGKPGSEPEEGDTNAAPAVAASLKESTGESSVILVGDVDMLYDDFTLRRINSPFGQLAMAMNANLNFAQNAVEQMAGDQNLIQVRSRATLNRPFEVVKRKQAEAEQRFQGEIGALQDKVQQAQQRVNELQAQKEGDQRFILSPEQEAELLKLQKEEVETSRKLRQVEKDLRREIVSLENTVKWVNILVMPLLVAAFGIGLAVLKSRRTGAR